MSEEHGRRSWADALLEGPKEAVLCGVLAICFGLFFSWVSTAGNTPIAREAALGYSGEFQCYETGKNHRAIAFADGTSYDLYPHTQTAQFEDAMDALPVGTRLWILVNPNNDCVVEVKTESRELLNFVESQEAIDSYDDWYVVIGMSVCIGGILIILYGLLKARDAKKPRQSKPALVPLYPADLSVKGRILLEAEAKGYAVCYRRVRHVNELVIDGQVYARYTGIVEFPHQLKASKNGHLITAGLHKEGYSFIRIDGKLIQKKKRWF